MLRSLCILALFTVACSGATSSSQAPDASAPSPTPSQPAADAPSTNAPTPAAPETGDTIDVKNPLGKVMQGKKHSSPAQGSAEHTLLGVLEHQASDGDFNGFLAHLHPSAKETPLQKENLKAYQWTSSRGKTAAACVHDGALITVGRKEVNAQIAGGGDTGSKIMVWCGEGRMPVPFTVYPDGETMRITKFGLN